MVSVIRHRCCSHVAHSDPTITATPRLLLLKQEPRVHNELSVSGRRRGHLPEEALHCCWAISVMFTACSDTTCCL
ncbi:hypothetical protein ACOMHN_027186 [Nucella lapillus]